MILVVAALGEELNLALNLCRNPESFQRAGARVWRGATASHSVVMLKTGIGPKRSAERLNRVLADFKPDRILSIGYCGALDPALRVGDLVIGSSASLLAHSVQQAPLLENLVVGGTWKLSFCDDLVNHASGAGLPVSRGHILTSTRVVGNPAQKQHLHRTFEGSVVDMETASLAQVAEGAAIPLCCARAVSDSAADSFLAPFGYDDANSRLLGRAGKLFSSGQWLGRYQQWREASAKARQALNDFLCSYL